MIALVVFVKHKSKACGRRCGNDVSAKLNGTQDDEELCCVHTTQHKHTLLSLEMAIIYVLFRARDDDNGEEIIIIIILMTLI